MKIKEKIFDAISGETSFIEREETSSEKEFRMAIEEMRIAEETEMEIKKQAKSVLLAKLGITEDEAKLLLA